MVDQLLVTQAPPDPRFEISKLAWWSLAFFLAAAACEIGPIVVAKAVLAPLAKSTAESYPFALVIALLICVGLGLQLVSCSLAIYSLKRCNWWDAFAYIALACNGVMVLLFVLV